MPAPSKKWPLRGLFWLACASLWLHQPTQAALNLPPCAKPGWFPSGFSLKDHTVFWHAGYYYIASIYLPGETQFAYGRSADLCHWETLTPILTGRIPGAWDEFRIWAPHVYQEGGIYYLFYTGVTDEFTQSILLATTTNPADPASWQPQAMLFQPDHPQSNWQAGLWADCRDPFVMKSGEQYYLYYTASDADGGIVGLATAASPQGPWTDRGATLPPTPGIIPESPTVFQHQGSFYLLYNYAYHPNGTYRISAGPLGPWGPEYTLSPGWAHEVWNGQDGQAYTSYLTDYRISIRPLTWNERFSPPLPFLGWQRHEIHLPLILAGW